MRRNEGTITTLGGDFQVGDHVRLATTDALPAGLNAGMVKIVKTDGRTFTFRSLYWYEKFARAIIAGYEKMAEIVENHFPKWVSIW